MTVQKSKVHKDLDAVRFYLCLRIFDGNGELALGFWSRVGGPMPFDGQMVQGGKKDAVSEIILVINLGI